MRAAIVFAALLIPAAAYPNPVDRYATSASGSERLGLYALSRMFDRYGNDPRVISALRRELERQGFYYEERGGRLISDGFWLSPRIGHNGNINGGMINDRFKYGDIIFNEDPSNTAKSGWVGGLAFGQNLRFAVKSGSFLDLSGRAELEYSPEHRIWANRAKISACLRHNAGGWNFVDLCHDAQDSERSLGRSHFQTTSVALSRMAETDNAYHELSIRLERSDYGYMDQTGISFAVKSAFDHFMPHISLFLAEPVAGEMAFRQRIDAGIRILGQDRNFGISLWAQKADGGRFLGESRRDLNVGLGASVDLAGASSFEISYARNMSNQPFFDYPEVSFSVNVRHLSW